MRFNPALVALIASLSMPSVALAQFEGLDLSSLPSEDQKSEPSESPSESSSGDFSGFGLDLNGATGADAQPADEPSGGDELPSLGYASSSTSASTASSDKKSSLPAEIAALDGRLREIELTAEDRVKSVQPRGFLKKGRFELMPSIFVTLNDAYFPKYGPGLRFAYHAHESFGIALRANEYNPIPNDNVRLAKRQLRSQLPDVQPEWSFALDFLWSPFYGKSKLGNSIRHFDLYVVGGLGTIISESFDDEGLLLATHLGLGSRFSLNDFIALDLSFIETVYVDRPQNVAGKGVIQHLFSVNLGLSFFIPFSFEYKE